MSSAFALRYKNDDEFRERHLNYMKEKVTCFCGKQIARSLMTSHKKTQKHQYNEQMNEVKILLKKLNQIK